jgi:CRISPR system Cascade subunit CasA
MIRVIDSAGKLALLSLPEVFAALSVDLVSSFPALRPHQAPAWHAFLVQVAAMGAEVLGLDEPPGDDPAAWAALLRALTPEYKDDEPWRLVAPLDRPAFFQPPVPEGNLNGFGTVEAPDALDLLITSKNHDFKAVRMVAAEPDDWIFALISLQTQEGFLGAGNYGIARMNGGFANRPYMRLGPSGGGFGAQVMRDLRVLIAQRDAIWDRAQVLTIGTRDDVVLPLVWLDAWDGTNSLPLSDLHPLFVEICRRVRLAERGEGLVARTASSKTARIASKGSNGVLDDPWAPVELGSDSAKLLTIAADGFSYRKVTELLFPSGKRQYRKPRLGVPQDAEKGRGLTLQLHALARGQGKTEGFHRREIDIPAGAAARLDGDDLTAQRAHERLRQAGTVEGKVLRPALIVLMQKGPEQPAWTKPSNDGLAGPTLRRFDQRVDQAFFPALWASLELEADAAALAWLKLLADYARQGLAEAQEAAPRSDERRVIAHARARNLLEGALIKNFPQLAPQQKGQDVF